MYVFLKPEKCSPSLQLEVQPAADMGFGGNTWQLWFDDILAFTSDFLGVLILPVFVGIIYLLNIFMFKSFELKDDDSKKN